MSRIILAFSMGLAASALWGCAEGPLAPDRQTSPTTGPGSEPSLTSTRSLAWSTPLNIQAVNSVATEQHPVLSKDGLSLYFASTRSGNTNLWVAQRDCTDISAELCPWSSPVMLGDAVNSSALDAAPALSRDEHQLFFISQRPRGTPTRPGDTCSAAPCDRDLWVSYREDVHNDTTAWEPAVNLGSPVNTNAEEVAPSYFEGDESPAQLFFNDGVINEAGLLVQGDMYVSQLTSSGTWSDRSPLSEINIPGLSDQRPSVSHNGRELYFHSSRSTPLGGPATIARIWVATRELVSDHWSTPVLVPSPISDVQTIHPFIHSLGRRETLLFVRGGDIWMSERTRAGSGK